LPRGPAGGSIGVTLDGAPMTAAGIVAPIGAGRRASGLLLGLAAALVLVDAAAGVLTGEATDPLRFAVFLLALAGLVAAGAVLLRDRRHEGLGRLLLGVAAAGALWDALGAFPGAGPFSFLQGFAYWGYVGLLVHVLVRWPDRRIDGPVARGLVIAVYALMPLLTALWQLAWDARWFGGREATEWWPTAFPSRSFSYVVWQVQQVLLLVLVAALLAVAIGRAVTARGARLLAMAPVTVVAVALAATAVLDTVRVLGAPIGFDPALVENLALLAIPVAVLWAALLEPAGIDQPAIPGRRLHLDDAARARYHLGFAGLAALAVVLASVAVVLGLDGFADSAPAPQPGPALVSH
jgi:hypothetical protein